MTRIFHEFLSTTRALFDCIAAPKRSDELAEKSWPATPTFFGRRSSDGNAMNGSLELLDHQLQ